MHEKLSQFGLKSLSYEPQAFELIAGTDEYATLQIALEKRNSKAFHLQQEPDRYEKAMSWYELDPSKLQAQAKQHACSERVKQYQMHCIKGAVVPRDRLAAAICADYKSHYLYLRMQEILSRDIKKQATAHLIRKKMASQRPKATNVINNSKHLIPDNHTQIVINRFMQLDKELEKAKSRPQAMFRLLASEAIEKYALKVGKDETLLKKLHRVSPAVCKRVTAICEMDRNIER